MTEPTANISQAERHLTQEILDIGDALIETKTQDLTRIDERRFVAVFLPMFAGDKEQPYAAHGANVDTWRKLAGAAQNEVIIVDDNNVELYRVPPLFDADALKPIDGSTPRTMNSIADMLARANLIAKQGPLAYKTFVDSELARRSQLFGEKKNEPEYIERWNTIFQRYNRPLIPESVYKNKQAIEDTNQASQPKLQNNLDNDDFEPIDS
jgi:hypothetical protein